MLVNRDLKTDLWTDLRVESSDVVGIRLVGPFGTIRVFNIYNDGANNASLDAIRRYRRIHPQTEYEVQPVHDIWAGDMNRHDPTWELPSNHHLFTRRNLELAAPLIRMVAEADMIMALPAAMPTLEALNSKNLTRPDNVFCSQSLESELILCTVRRDLQPPKTDHFPILCHINIVPTRREFTPKPNFRTVDWEKFREDLKRRLTTIHEPREIDSITMFQQHLTAIDAVVAASVEEVVPKTKDTPYCKRWWSNQLKAKKKEVQRLGGRAARKEWERDHPVHHEYRQAKVKYAQMIQDAKVGCWAEWLEGQVSAGADMWKASKMVSSEPSDGGTCRVPELEKPKPEGDKSPIEYISDNATKAELFFELFFLPRPDELLTPHDEEYPQPRWTFRNFSDKQVEKIFRGMKPNKATKAGSVHNNIMIHCADLLAPYMGPIYRATFNIEHYPDDWAEYGTQVIRKPGKPDYRKRGAHRPVVYSDGWARGLNSGVGKNLQWACEKFGLLPPNHFGGRPGRTTTDAIMALVCKVKQAWRSKKVASALFLDVESAFPSVDIRVLAHEMRMMGVPNEYVEWMMRRMAKRRTRLMFDDFCSDWISVDNGIDQGDPASGMYWLIYSAALLRIFQDKNSEHGLAYMDDLTVVAVGRNVKEAHKKLEKVICRKDGVLDWAKVHNCRFGMLKTYLVDFTREKERIPVQPQLDVGQAGNRTPPKKRGRKTRPKKGPPIQLQGHTITPVESTRLLGVVLDAELNWSEQIAIAMKKGQTWVSQFYRLSKVSGGAASRIMRRFFQAIAIPRMLYAAEVWLTPTRSTRNAQGVKERNVSAAVITKLASIQRQAARMITGAMRTTATDVTDFHANLLPMHLYVDKLRHRAATRLGTLPVDHPLWKDVRKPTKHSIKRHRGPIDDLVQTFKIQPECMETIQPIRQSPRWEFQGEVVILSGQEAVDFEAADQTALKIYTDGSGVEGRVGAAAVMFHKGLEVRAERFHLGSLQRHEVYDAEGVGLLMAMDMVRRRRQTTRRVVIYADSEAAIRAVLLSKPTPSHYIWDAFHQSYTAAKRRHPDLRVTIRWIPGHKGIVGNERADEEAKRAARNRGRRKKGWPAILRQALPWNRSSIRKTFSMQLQRHAEQRWTSSKRYRRLRTTDPARRPNKFQALIKPPLTKTHISILTQLRTTHCPLNAHLHRIRQIDHPKCEHCSADSETVEHFLLHCPAFAEPRRQLRHRIGYAAGSLSKLLSTRKHLPHLMTFIRGTGRFSNTFPHIPDIDLGDDNGN
jgi:ribonuclease HI